MKGMEHYEEWLKLMRQVGEGEIDQLQYSELAKLGVTIDEDDAWDESEIDGVYRKG